MKFNLIKKPISTLLLVSILLQYFIVVPITNKAIAEDTTDQPLDNAAGKYISDMGSGIPNGQLSPLLTTINTLIDTSEQMKTGSGNAFGNKFTDLFGTTNARIILKKTDYTAIKALYCIRQAIPDYPNYNTNLELLAKDAKETGVGSYTADQLRAMQGAFSLTEKKKFSDIMRATLAAKYPEDKIRSLIEQTDLRTLECITGMSTNAVRAMRGDTSEAGKANYQKILDNSLKATRIDLRIIKTLVYLVTPTSQGGAGHRRIRVHRIFQHREYSTESDAIIGELNEQANGQTAADVGAGQRESADATIEDPNGTTQADAWFDDMTKSEDDVIEINRSAHFDGQAVDISEVDDIRCTVIKRRHLGKDSRIKQTPQPIKLAWQTTDGYSQSGGNNAFDFMELLRNQVREMYQNFALEYGTDISGYEGDLSNAQLGDLAALMGRALFSESINAPGRILDGQNVEEVTMSLGAAYLADLFKVPRSVLMNRDFSAVDDISMIVGEAVVEQRTQTPVGILEPIDQKLLVEQRGVLDLYLQTVGRRRLAYEMNLGLDDLADYQTDLSGAGNGSFVGIVLVGKKAVEKAFSLPAGAFDAANFEKVKARIGPVKSLVFTLDPDYVDKTLHIPLGSTKKIVKDSGSAIKLVEYLTLVGQTRINDTVNGFKYLATHDVAYNLPEETWARVTNGNVDALRELGIFHIVQAFADEGDNHQRLAMTSMIEGALNLPADQDNKCTGDSLNQTVTLKNAQGFDTEKKVVVSERTAQTAGLVSGELCRAFARKNSQASAIFERIGEKHIYYTLLEKIENEDPDFLIDGGNIPFRVKKLHRMTDLINGIKDNWDKLRQDERLKEDREFIEQADSIIQLLQTITANTMSLDFLLVQDQVKQATTAAVDFKRRIEQKKRELPDLQDQINKMIDQINEAYRCGAEAIEGRTLPSLDQIEKPEDIIRREAENSAGSNDSGRNDPKSTKIKFSAVMIYGLLKRQITPRHFLQQLATNKLEAELNLPRNSLNYYIQNMEIRDINSVDAFFQAIGQAKIEQELKLPDYYFQGPIYQGMPKFEQVRFEYQLWPPMAKLSERPEDKEFNNNFYLLKKYYLASEETVVCYNFGIANTCGQPANVAKHQKEIKKDDPGIDQLIVDLYVGAKLNKVPEAIEQWKKLIKLATKTFVKEQETLNKNSDKTMDDVAKNVDYRNSGNKTGSDPTLGNNSIPGLNLPPGRVDVMAKLGLQGSLEATMTASSWRTASFAGNRGRAAEIDRILDVPGYGQNQITNTQALFTGENFRLKDGRDYLTEDEKKQLTGQFSIGTYSTHSPDPGTEAAERPILAKISDTALDRFLQLLNNEIDVNGFRNSTSRNVFYNGFNPYNKNSRLDDSGGNCKIIYVIRGGIEVADSVQNDSYVYVDVEGKPHSFRTEEAAIAYARQAETSERTYLDIFAKDVISILNNIVLVDGTVNIPDEYFDQNWMRNRIVEYAQGNRGIDLLPFDKLFDRHAILYSGQPTPGALAGTRLGDFSGELLVKLFGKLDRNEKPLQRFRQMVGQNEAARSITQSLIDALPFPVNPRDIAAEDIFAILNGDFRPLVRLGAHLIDNGLGLPANTTYAILTLTDSPNPLKDLECTVMDAGAQFLGQLVGLDRVALSGNPAELIRNIGQAKVESVLGLPSGTFYGPSLWRDGMIRHINPLDFALAINVPLETPPETAGDGLETIESSALKALEEIDAVLGTKLANANRNAPADRLVRAVRDNVFAVIDKGKLQYYPILQAAVIDRMIGGMPDIIAHAGDKNSPFWKGKYRQSAEAFISRIIYIDNAVFTADLRLGIFNSIYHSFADVLSQKISPDDYNEIVAKQIAWYLGTDKLMENLGLDQDQETAIRDLMKNLTCVYYNQPGQGVAPDRYGVSVCDAGWHQNWGKVATNIAKIFHSNLDEDLGLTKGSTEALLNFNPDAPYSKVDILINNAAYDLDDRFKLLDKDHNFQWLFARTSEWWHNYDDQRDTRALQQRVCRQDINYEAYLTPQEQTTIRSIPAQIQQIAFKARTGGYVCESNNCESEMSETSLTKLTNPDYYRWQRPNGDWTTAPAEVGEVVRLWTQFEVLRSQGTNACLNGARHEDAEVPDGSTIGRTLGWSTNRRAQARTLLRNGMKFLAERACEKIREETKGTVNITADQLMGLFSKDFLRYFMIITTAYGVNTYVNSRQGGDGRVEVLPPGLWIMPEDITYSFLGNAETEAALAEHARFNALAPETPYRAGDNYRPLGALPEGIDHTSQMAADARMTAVPRNGQALQSHTVAAIFHDSDDPLYMTVPERQQMESLYNSDECRDIYSAAAGGQSGSGNETDSGSGNDAGSTNRCMNAKYAYDRINDPRFNTWAARQTWLAEEHSRLTTIVSQDACRTHLNHIRSGQTSADNPDNSSGMPNEDRVACETAATNLRNYDNADNDARRQARKAFRDNLQYRMMDALWYKMDENVYPGFAWDIIRGSGEQKLRALGNYVLTGLQRGRLFGQDVTFLRGTDIRGWASALESITRIETAANHAERNQQLGNFINSAGYNTLENWLNNTLWRNFKFRLPPKFLASAFVSIYTGYWFRPDSTTSGFSEGRFMAGRNPIPTLGEAAINWGIEHYEGVVFRWADKRSGLPVGTSYEMYKLAKNIYTAAKAVRAFNKVRDNAQGLAKLQPFQSAMKSVEAVKAGGTITVNGTEWVRQADGTFTHAEDLSLYNGEDYFVEFEASPSELAEDMTHEFVDKALGAALNAALTYALNKAVEKFFGDELATLDRAWNLPPGTMMMAAGVAVGYISAAIVHAFIPKFPIMTPEMLAIQLALVLIVALTGVYKVDVTCSADGYYPEKRGADDTVSQTGLGEWDGKNADLHRQKSMEAAQIKARDLVGDMLRAQFNPLFEDVIPNQIMTGRQEDVDYWKGLINDNICRRIGEDYHADSTGVCTTGESHNDEERAGAFVNPQNVAFTHIGF